METFNVQRKRSLIDLTLWQCDRITLVLAYIVAGGCSRSGAVDDVRFLGERNPVVEMSSDKESMDKIEIDFRL